MALKSGTPRAFIKVALDVRFPDFAKSARSILFANGFDVVAFGGLRTDPERLLTRARDRGASVIVSPDSEMLQAARSRGFDTIALSGKGEAGVLVSYLLLRLNRIRQESMPQGEVSNWI